MPTYYVQDQEQLDAPWFSESWTLSHTANHTRVNQALRLAIEDANEFLEENNPLGCTDFVTDCAPGAKDALLRDAKDWALGMIEHYPWCDDKGVYLDAFITHIVDVLSGGKNS